MLAALLLSPLKATPLFLAGVEGGPRRMLCLPLLLISVIAFHRALLAVSSRVFVPNRPSP